MAIVNVTPDSFYPNSRHSAKTALEQIYRLLEQKIAYIDIGAASSRPDSLYTDASTEMARLKDLCTEIKSQNLYKHAKFSIDTYNPQTATFALEHGFCVLNDVNGFNDPRMFSSQRVWGASGVDALFGRALEGAPTAHSQKFMDRNGGVFSRKNHCPKRP